MKFELTSITERLVSDYLLCQMHFQNLRFEVENFKYRAKKFARASSKVSVAFEMLTFLHGSGDTIKIFYSP